MSFVRVCRHEMLPVVAGSASRFFEAATPDGGTGCITAVAKVYVVPMTVAAWGDGGGTDLCCGVQVKL